MSVDGYNGDMAYQLKRIADALEKLNRKLDEMTRESTRTGETVRELRILPSVYRG